MNALPPSKRIAGQPSFMQERQARHLSASTDSAGRGFTYLSSMQGLRQMKVALGREKDRRDVALIDAFLRTGPAIQG